MLPRNTLVQNRYRIVQPIDGRANGQVYRAQDEQNDRAVLLGVLPLDAPRATAMPQRAQHVIAARQDQPPTIIDYFADGARFCIICNDPSDHTAPPGDPAPSEQDVMRQAHALLDVLDELQRQFGAAVAPAPPSQWQPDPEPPAAPGQPRGLSTGWLIGLVAGLVLLVTLLCVVLLALLLLRAPPRNPFGLGGYYNNHRMNSASEARNAINRVGAASKNNNITIDCPDVIYRVRIIVSSPSAALHQHVV